MTKKCFKDNRKKNNGGALLFIHYNILGLLCRSTFKILKQRPCCCFLFRKLFLTFMFVCFRQFSYYKIIYGFYLSFFSVVMFATCYFYNWRYFFFSCKNRIKFILRCSLWKMLLSKYC